MIVTFYDNESDDHLLRLNELKSIPFSVGDCITLSLDNHSEDKWDVETFTTDCRVVSIERSFNKIYPRSGNIQHVKEIAFIDVRVQEIKR